MFVQPRALDHLRALLGSDATSDALWRDIRLFESTALPIVNATWELDRTGDHDMWQILHRYNATARAQYEQRCAEAAHAIQASLGGEAASRCAAAFFLHPQLWRPVYAREHRAGYWHLDSLQAHLLHEVAQLCLAQPPPDWAARLSRRLIALCNAANVEGAPDMAACVHFLLACGDPGAQQFLDALSAGAWDAAWQRVIALAGEERPGLAERIFGTNTAQTPILTNWHSLSEAERLKALWQTCGAQHTLALLERLRRQGRLNSAAFRNLLEATPGSLGVVNNALQCSAAGMPLLCEADLITALRPLVDAVLWEMICDLRPESWPTLAQIAYLGGGRYLLRLAEEVERRELTRLPAMTYGSERLAPVLARLLGALRRHNDDSAALVALLRQLSAPTLLAILPRARAYEAEIAQALGWEGATALLALLDRLQSDDSARSANPMAGVVPRQEVLDVVAPTDEAHARALLDAFAEQLPAAVLLARAALGWNRAEVRRLFGRRSQLAARAMGLLPLEKPGELLDRYLLLARFAREANTSRAGRKVYERAAAQAGLANLALQAGYADATRLEWAMEDRVGAQGVNLGRSWQIEGYTLALTLRAGVPALEVRNDKRTLKRVPPAITRDYAYREVRATLEQAQAQEQRYRQALLEAMRRGQPLSYDELALLRRNPLAAQLLERLVLKDERGAFGLFRADDCSLEGCYGERIRVEGPVSIAHPYMLAQAGLLVDWQSEIVRRQVVQPFRQLFRELYIVTPAELEAGSTSNRLAGRRLKSRQALAILANLGWLIDGYGAVSKSFYDLGFTASFETGSYGYGEAEEATTGALTFWRHDYRVGDHDERRLKLADVPPLIFSEVLRDLDLVTVIAHQSEEHGTSREVLQRRGDLVRATAAALGLSQVRVEEPNVYVRGSLTSYRIHLATAAIYTESGQYLCVVPRPKERKAIYVPFEEGGEPISSEIISKVLLLAHDAAIADPTILAQIAPLRAAA